MPSCKKQSAENWIYESKKIFKMNKNLEWLQPYPFEKLAKLKSEVEAPTNLEHIALSIGEPKHAPPAFVLEALTKNLGKLANYPLTKGIPELRQNIATWLTQRFNLSPGSIDSEHNVIPVAGTREALFSIAQAVVTPSPNARIVMPNPFYQIYEGAAYLSGAQPVFLNCDKENNFVPNFASLSEQTWKDCSLLYICSPGNPTGAVLSFEVLEQLIELADEHDFIIASDECYSEIYFEENQPPIGLLEACAKLGRHDYKRCLVFHSLSKRSNLPGLRSGFVAGDAEIIAQYLRYRTYQGCALPVPTQLASIAAWSDEHHVLENRNLYRQKFKAVLEILGEELNLTMPDAGFYLWPQTPIDDAAFAQQLFAQQNVTVLPGQYLGRATSQGNPGKHYVRMALVASVDECVDAAQRIKTFLSTLKL